uniref:C2H2-type domain-containing protein n=1 Tax=Ascaris lumbricoides TaxID=6252 RepID=A0A0M3HS36_ASCLU
MGIPPRRETKDELEEHSSSEHADGDGQRTEEQCPLCPSKSVQLRTHLAEEHKIAEEAIQRLLMGAASSSTLPDSTSDNNWFIYALCTVHRTASVMSLLLDCPPNVVLMQGFVDSRLQIVVLLHFEMSQPQG